MRTLALICNQCGAPIQAPESLHFVTCTHCNTRLKIVNEGGGAYTELLEDIRDTQADMASDLDTIRLQNELESVDREWEAKERSFERIDRSTGRRKLPSEWSGVSGFIVGAVMAVFGLIATRMSEGSDSVVFVLFALAGVAVALVSIVRGSGEKRRYISAKRRHWRRRRKVLEEFEQQDVPNDEQ